jgi:hypothetical protein
MIVTNGADELNKQINKNKHNKRKMFKSDEFGMDG